MNFSRLVYASFPTLALFAVTAALLHRSPSGAAPSDVTPPPLASGVVSALGQASGKTSLGSAPSAPVTDSASAYDPLAVARAAGRQVNNPEAVIPPQCYTKTTRGANPCWTCHTQSGSWLGKSDVELQEEYAFSDAGQTNHWTNLFEDRSAAIATISDAAALEYVRQDNYTALRRALGSRSDFRGYVPDLDLARGFDEAGFARDGSGWRALRYKPFPGLFWPTNGSTDDVMIRLPAKFRERAGVSSSDLYKINLAVLEASFLSDRRRADAEVNAPTEPLDERAVRVDLDGDGQLGTATRIVALPSHYFGDAASVRVRRAIYPEGTEFLHTVRYLDPAEGSFMATRMKEVRYSRKSREIGDAQILRRHEREADEKDEGKLPFFQGQADLGLVNDFGWTFQGYIEDEAGRLRLQTHEEHVACMGCHSGVGVTLDGTFAFPRKLPGLAGYRHQDLRGIPDAPQLGHSEPEFLTYLRRALAGDEFRQNDELLARFVPAGKIAVSEVLRSAPGGDRDLSHLVFPSPERAVLLNKAYMALARQQRFDRGRDVLLGAATNVHARIVEEDTGLVRLNRVYTDGQLRLDWTRAELVMR